MTTASEPQLPPITCPSSLIASCPPLLGFHPESSLICLVHTPGSARPVVARVDIVADDHAQDCAADLAVRLARTGGSHATVVLWVEATADTPRAELPGLALVECLERSLSEHGVIVDLAVATNGQVWWPLLCANEGCCPDRARDLDAEVAGRVQVEYAVAGFAPLSERADLGRRLASDPLSVARSRRFLAATPAPSGSLVSRRRQVDQLWSVLRPFQSPAGHVERCDPAWHVRAEARAGSVWPQRPRGARATVVPSPESAIRALADVGVRDALLVRFANDESFCRTCWQHSIEVLVDVVRAAPPGHAAPAATLLALVAWLSGDGALATVAVDRALADDPQYRLAHLVGQLVGSGLDPRAWRATAAGLTEEECLRKTKHAAQGARR